MAAYLDKAFNEERLTEELGNPFSEFYFLKDDDKVTGYLKVNRKGAQSEFNDPDSLEIERIYIEEAYQGRGLGTMLLNKAKEIARESNITYLWLGVWEKNPRAIKMYERNGFKLFSDHEFVMGDEIQIDWLMMCRVS